MKFTFLSIERDASNYVQQKLKTLLAYDQPENSPSPNSSTLQNAVSQTKNKAPRIASAEEFFKTTAAQMRQVEVAQRCALLELAREFPLIDGEAIKEDFFSYLLEPFEDAPEYTAVLRRKTNMSEMLFFFEFVMIDNGKVVHLAPPQPEAPVHPPRARLGIDLTRELIVKLLKKAGASVASAGLSKLGAFLVNLVIKEIFGDDTQKMLKEIESIVRREVEGNELAKVEGTINGTLQFLKTEYRNLREAADLNDVKAREKLLTRLEPYTNDFYLVLGMLMTEKYAVRGLNTFMLAAPVHLVLTQEMALIDPLSKDPNKSSFLQTLRENATDYRKHVENTFNKAMSQRNNMEVFNKPFVDCINNSCVHKNMVMWRDNVSGEQAGEFMSTKDPKRSAWENASISLEKHRTEVLNKLTEELGNPRETFLAHIGALEKFSFPSPAKAGLKLPAKKLKGV